MVATEGRAPGHVLENGPGFRGRRSGGQHVWLWSTPPIALQITSEEQGERRLGRYVPSTEALAAKQEASCPIAFLVVPDLSGSQSLFTVQGSYGFFKKMKINIKLNNNS